ncbi:MAG TPA: peptide-methionine (S)-S-oxide reductase MsrA [Candidatus Acidoferrales bacterium]|jgi:peptide-methionine (S)-S-oxide reductase|nr:peptide-methionine (S)-S-oxide reductase MsrA [Candidatus Acidoferrales bacterium]
MTSAKRNGLGRWMRLAALLPVLAGMACTAHGQVPAYVGKEPTPAKGEQTAVVAGGCFWGVDAVFKHVKGVTSVVSGYAGGNAGTAQYEVVSTGTTGHAESVKITYDASQITYGELLRIFFSVAHNPTELNRQGPDTGTQYRSAIFYANEGQKEVAEAYIEQLNQAKAFPRQIVTQVTPLKGFYAAEEYHQNFLARHPDYPYIVYNDLPKLRELQKEFPSLYR